VFGDSLTNAVPQSWGTPPRESFYRGLSRLLFELRDLVVAAKHRKLILPSGDTQDVTANSGVAVTGVSMRLSSSGAVTVAAVPTIDDGEDGQLICLTNVGSNNITIQDQGTLAGSNLRLAAATVVLTPRDSLWLRYDAVVGDWLQVTTLVGVV
jgi:hypothetical protein